MLDMLGDGGLPSGDSAAAESRGMGLAAPKLSGGKSSSGSILGLPPLAVYGGAAGIALLFALGLVYMLGGFSSSSSVAQGPAMPVAPPVSRASQPAAPRKRLPRRRPLLRHLLRRRRPFPPGAVGALGTPVPSPATPNPSGSPTPGRSAASPSTMPAAPAADPANWKRRIPIVRSVDAESTARAKRPCRRATLARQANVAQGARLAGAIDRGSQKDHRRRDGACASRCAAPMLPPRGSKRFASFVAWAARPSNQRQARPESR